MVAMYGLLILIFYYSMLRIIGIKLIAHKRPHGRKKNVTCCAPIVYIGADFRHIASGGIDK